MKKRSKRKQPPTPRPASAQTKPPNKRRSWPLGLALALAAVACAIIAAVAWRATSAKRQASPAYVSRPAGTVTFTKDIAPIIFRNCASCHRPGQSAPFSLLSYEDVRKKAESIVDVTGRRYMPPWLPEHGYGEFVGERRLSVEEIGLIKQWFAEGAVEGKPADLPPMPKWPEGWELGQPDLVVQLPSPYTLAAEGKDVYRNFLVPIPTAERRFVKAVEFHPGNNKVVHHAFIEVDATRQSRHLADHVKPPGFDGMQLPESVQMPGGQMLGWQPGKPPYVSPEGLSWVLEPGSDLVLQLHLHPSGKPEPVQSSVGFYFTDNPPTNTAFRINLQRYTIDIPAGAKDYSIENRYVLPVDVDLLRILPHTHYLGKELQGYAILPDGSRKWLILIKNWDFNWQGDYRYAQPVFLPKGTILVMHFTYDNSAENIHNPSQPPKRVKYGLQTTDEMGELWFQALARNAADRDTLAKDHFLKLAQDAVEGNQLRLQTNPQDADAQLRLGSALFALGRASEALEHLRAASQLRPDDNAVHYQLGSIYLRQNRLDEARLEFEAVLRVKPDDFQASGSLGFVFLRQGKLNQAEFYFENALRINPNDPIARANLARIRQARDAGRPGN
jgi:tetratricopeptide (TPR) repeat protein/mono/diheme cytochrome c family protein